MNRRDASLVNRMLCVALSALLVCTLGWSASAWGFGGAGRNLVSDESVPMASLPIEEDNATSISEDIEEEATADSASAASSSATSGDADGEADETTAEATSDGDTQEIDSHDAVASSSVQEPSGSNADSAADPLVSHEEAAAAAEERDTALEELGYVPGEVVVVYEEDATSAEKEEALEVVEGAEIDEAAEFDAGDVSKVEISDDVTVEKAAEMIAEDPAVKFAIPNYIGTLLDAPAVNEGYGAVEAERIGIASQTSGKLDAFQSEQWYLDYVKAPQAWNLLANKAPALQKVKVAVIDSGASLTHTDLQRVINKKASIEIIYDGDPYTNSSRGSIPLRGDGYTNGGAAVDETSSHGTHVSGIIAGEAGNGGMLGVASGGNTAAANDIVELTVIDAFPIRVLNQYGNYEPSATVYDFIYALAYARDNGVRVVNMSLGFPGTAEDLNTAMEQITTELVVGQNMVLVAAAGNDGQESKMLPAACSNVIGVMSVSDSAHLSSGSSSFSPAPWKTGTTTRSWFSTYGDWYDVAAPGEDIVSTYVISGTTDGFGYMSGTSMACPVVSATAAMVLAANPGLSATEVGDLLRNTATDLNTKGKDVQSGYGLVNAEAAVAKAIEKGGGATAEAPSAPEEPSEPETPKTYDPLTLKVTYDKSSLACGKPITFTMEAGGGSGNYKYLQNYINVYMNGYYTDDADWTRKKYVESNTFQYEFVASGTYAMRVFVMDMETFETKSTVLTLTVDDARYPSIEQVASNIVKECEKKNFKTEYEKALFLHDWIIDNSTYDHSLLYDGESGVLIRGTGTCESYHRAFTLLLNRMGINCYRATGNGHVWSCVKLDGQWTQIDATWNGTEYSGNLAFMRHLYFGITDDMTKLVHDEHKPVSTRPCTTYDNNYFLRSGEISRWTTPLEKQIREKVNAGQTSFSLNAEYTPYPNVYHIVYPLAAYQLNKTNWNIANKSISVKFVQTDRTSGYYYVSVKTTKPTSTGSSATGSGSSGSSSTKPPSSSGTSGSVTAPKPTVKPTTPVKTPSTTSKVPAQTIAPGTYTISTMLNKGKVLDIAGGSKNNGANVQIYQSNGTKAQQFKLTYDKKTGYYTITNVQSGKVLDLSGGKAANGRNVQQYKSNNSKAQRWIITGSASKGYTIASAVNKNYVLDVAGGSSKNGANVQVYKSNGSKAQKYVFNAVKSSSATNSGKTIADGTYVIETGVSSGKCLDISGGSAKNGANVQIYAKNKSSAQKFRIKYDSKTKAYIITNVKSGKVLDLSGGKAANGRNVQQYKSNNSKAQRWIITGSASKGYTIASAVNKNYVLDVAGGSSKNGANVQVYKSNGSKAQKFFLRKV